MQDFSSRKACGLTRSTASSNHPCPGELFVEKVLSAFESVVRRSPRTAWTTATRTAAHDDTSRQFSKLPRSRPC